MRFEDFVIDFQPPVTSSILVLKKTFCACHWKEVWVTESEPLPYLCRRLKELPSADLRVPLPEV